MPEITPETLPTPEQLVEQLFGLPDLAAQQHFITANRQQFNCEAIAEAIKREADRFLRSDLQRSLAAARLIICQGECTENLAIRALGLLAEANVHAIGRSDYQRAITLSQEAADIFRQLNRPFDQARVEIVQIYPLSCLGQYEDAIQLGEQIVSTLYQYQAWRFLLVTIMNLGIVHSRHGDDTKALAMFDEAGDLCPQLASGRESQQALIQLNRAVSLRNLGRFDAAIEASEKAEHLFQALGQTVEAARALQSRAMTYYVLGRYNEALDELERARLVFSEDGRLRDTMLVELFMSDCLLQLRRFHDVLDKCARVRRLFHDLGEQHTLAQATINEAAAYAHLGRYTEAFSALQEALQIFAQQDNQVWMAITKLEISSILYAQARYEECLAVVQAVIATLHSHEFSVEAAHGQLIAARAALALQRTELAYDLSQQVLALGIEKNIPALTYHSYQLLGVLAESHADVPQALGHYDAAIEALERLRGRLMVEFRAAFLEDKQAVYENAVRLCIATNQPSVALEYAERAKSRALLDLLTYRLNLGIQARQPEDQPLVARLLHLRSERDRLYRRWESSEDVALRGRPTNDAETLQVEQQVLVIEKEITELWHKLLIQHADYARDAALWQVRVEPVQPWLATDTILIEYFVVSGRLVIFTVTAEAVTAHYLPGDLAQVQKLLQLLQVNLNTIPKSSLAQVAKLTQNAQGLLQRLYQLLLAPVQQQLASAVNVIVVPHGPLHYLPFHALHDGASYLIEKHAITYLPGASMLRYCQVSEYASRGALIYSDTLQGKLPHTEQEAMRIAQILGEQPFHETSLTVGQLQDKMATARIVHLATHGDFRADNPLFSGLVVGQQWLTTLDIFNMHLHASLVTLSACQTGRNVVQGGDELAGLMKAFLSAGAASLVLSLWAVEDSSTAQLMERFYHNLATGQTKSMALRNAQLAFLHPLPAEDLLGAAHKHPYFWAPFFLVGHAGYL